MSLILAVNIAFIIWAIVLLLAVTTKAAVMLATIGLFAELVVFVVTSVALLTNQKLVLVKFRFEEEEIDK